VFKKKASLLLGTLYKRNLIEKEAMIENYSEMNNNSTKSGVGIVIVDTIIEASKNK